MLGFYKKIFLLLDKKERIGMVLVLAVMLLTAVVEMFSVISIVPFLTVLADPGMVDENQWLNLAYTRLGFDDVRSFLFFLGFAAFIFLLISALVRALNEWVIVRFSHMRQYSISRRLMTHYLSRPYTFFLTRNSSDLAKSVLDETSQIVGGAIFPAMRLISYTLISLTILALLIAADPWLALSVAGALAVLYGGVYLTSRMWLHRIGRERVAANKARFAAATEAFAGAKEIRLLGRERVYLDRYQNPAKRFARHQASAKLLSALPKYVIEAIIFGGILLIVLYLMADETNLARALPVIGLYVVGGKKLIPAFQNIFQSLASMRFSTAAVDNVITDLSYNEPLVPLPSGDDLPDPLIPRQQIELRQITYYYPDCNVPALLDLNLVIPAHHTVGLIGASGAGKSTLVDLLLGLLEQSQGKILVDGVPIARDNLRNWQAGIGYVPQHIFLADDTVRSNIALGVQVNKLDNQAVEQAARLANLHDFVINELPNGYDTVIGEKGVRLSGGQRQRIGIARALYRNPPVLVLDEATSALDNATERAVMEAVHNLAHQKTIIIIAHRLSTVKPSDHIFVLESGRLVEDGTWDELSEGGMKFKSLAAGM